MKMLLQSTLVSSYLFFLMLKETKSDYTIIKYKWAESDPDFIGEVRVSWKRDGMCQISGGTMGQGTLGQGNTGQGNMEQGNMGQGTLVSGTCNDPTMDLNVYGNQQDTIGAGRASWQYSMMDYGGCNSLNSLVLSIFPGGDQRSPQQFRLRVKEMCCDQKCGDNFPNIDCLYGPPGRVLNINTFWVNPCFNLPRNQTATPSTPTDATQNPTGKTNTAAV